MGAVLRMAIHRRVAAALLITTGVLAIGLLGACASKTSDTESSKVVKITIIESGGKITPSGDTVTAHTGQDITLAMTSDRDDEIHVHSDPEHEFELSAGKPKTVTFAIDTPGTYIVESHHLDVVIVKLQVS